MAVVARFRDLPEAEVASASLEAAGITNCLADAQTVGVDWGYSTALGGIRLLVGEADLAEARAVLELPTAVEWPELPAGSADEQCSACGAFSLELESGPRKTMALMTMVSMPLWFWRSRMRCRSCGRSTRVPLRFRPEIAVAWLAVGMAATILAISLTLVIGWVVYGRRG